MGKRKTESKRGKRVSTEEKKIKIKKNKEKYNKKKDIEAKRERKRLKKAEKERLKEEKERLKTEKEAAGVESKKRKREDETESQVAKPPKKKASKTGFPDPIRDKGLPQQARKVLAYAFDRYDKPTRWKFNKSRQNWLIRHVWNSQSITDAHMPLTLKYLSSLQGYARENLLKKCTSILEAPPTVDPITEEAASNPTNKKSSAEIRIERARAIFDAVSAANPETKPVEEVTKNKKTKNDEEDSDSDSSASSSSESSSSESSSE